VTGLVFLNKQWGRIFIREVLAKPEAGPRKYAFLLYEVIRHCGIRRSYQIWSGLPSQLLSWLGFVDVGKRGDFRHDIAVRGYNLEPREEEWVHEVFSRGESGLSLLDFDC
jgi:hypothetical protein